MNMQLFLMSYSWDYSERCQEALLSYCLVLSRQDQLHTLLFNLTWILTGYFETTCANEASYFISTFKFIKRLSFCVMGFCEHLQANQRFSQIIFTPMSITDYVELDGYSASLASCHGGFVQHVKIAGFIGAIPVYTPVSENQLPL